jgi:hypothetical protein
MSGGTGSNDGEHRAKRSAVSHAGRGRHRDRGRRERSPAQIKIILSDIGFSRMRRAIDDAENDLLARVVAEWE